MAAQIKFTLDDTFISSDIGNGWAATYRLVNGKVKVTAFRTLALVLLAQSSMRYGQPKHSGVR